MKIYNVKLWAKPSYEVYDVFYNEHVIRFLKNENSKVGINKFKKTKWNSIHDKCNFKEIKDVPFLDDSYFTNTGLMDNDQLTKTLYFEIIKQKYNEN